MRMNTSSDKTAVYAGVAALVVVGVVLVILCILCKFCLTSRKAQRWSGLDNVLSKNKHKHQHGNSYSERTIIRHDTSASSLKIETPAFYTGYNSMEWDVSITKLPDYVTKENGIGYNSNHDTVPKDTLESMTIDIDKENTVPSQDDIVDISRLKSSMPAAKHHPNRHPPMTSTKHTRTSRMNGSCGHSIHNNYTIYEETSDLSGNETPSANGGSLDRKLHHSDSANPSSDDESLGSGSDYDGGLIDYESVESVESSLELLGQHTEDSSLGQVEYSLQYYRENNQLVVHLMQARNLDLPTNINGNLPDTFIKTFATDCHDQDPKKQTKICKSTADPIFKENFFFCVHQHELPTASITLQVFTRDHYARQRLVGEICVGLTPLTFTDYYRTWSNILDYDHQPPISYAELEVGLGHDQSANEFTVSFSHLKLLRLDASPINQCKEFYMAATLFTKENQPRQKKRTQSVPASTSRTSCILEDKFVIFNQVDRSTLQESRLLIELCHKYGPKSYQTLGFTVLGEGTSDEEYGHWLILTNENNQYTPQQPIRMQHNINLRKSIHNSHLTM